jgi:hypothetical protein
MTSTAGVGGRGGPEQVPHQRLDRHGVVSTGERGTASCALTGSRDFPAFHPCGTAVSPHAMCSMPCLCRRVQDLFQSVQLNVNNPTFLIMQGRITKVRAARWQRRANVPGATQPAPVAQKVEHSVCHRGGVGSYPTRSSFSGQVTPSN